MRQFHAAAGQPSVDQLAASDLFGPEAVVDVSTESAADPDYRMTRQDLLDWESEHGAIPEGAVVLILDSLLDIRYWIFDI